MEDANTPFRLMKSDQLGNVIQKIPADYPLSNVLMTVIYTKSSMPVQYFPITFRPRQGGKNSINMKKIVKIGYQSVGDFLKLRNII